MPDITLCMNENCPIRQHCGRFIGKPKIYLQRQKEKIKSPGFLGFFLLDLQFYCVIIYATERKKECIH